MPIDKGGAYDRAELIRLATVVLGRHGRADQLVDKVCDRAVRAHDPESRHRTITHEQMLRTFVVRECRELLRGYAGSQIWARARAAERALNDPAVFPDTTAVPSLTAGPDRLREVLADLPDADRVVVAMVDVCGWSLAECSTVTRTSNEIVTAQLARGRAGLLLALFPPRTDQPAPATVDLDSCSDVRSRLLRRSFSDVPDAVVQNHAARCVACNAWVSGADDLSAALRGLANVFSAPA